MQIDISGDRKRLFISAGTALIIHVILLVIIGLSRTEYIDTPEFGPLSVQISLDRPNERIKEPDPIETFEAEDAPAAEVNEPEPEEIPATPSPVETPAPAPVARPIPPPVVKPAPVVKKPVVDDSIIEAIKNRSGGSSGGRDARSVFGDDPMPAETDNSSTTAASVSSGGDSGSAVVLSDAPVVGGNTAAVEDNTSAAVSVLDSNLMSSLDQKLSNTSSQTTDNSSDSRLQSAEVVTGSVSGDAPVFAFKDPSSSRALLQWAPPEIPEDVQKAGVSRYTIIIDFDIDSDGVTSGARLLKTSGDSRIDAAVQSALRSWIFEDSLSTQKKVRATLTYVIEIK